MSHRYELYIIELTTFSIFFYRWIYEDEHLCKSGHSSSRLALYLYLSSLSGWQNWTLLSVIHHLQSMKAPFSCSFKLLHILHILHRFYTMFLSSQGVKVAFLAGPDQRAKQLEAGGTACDMRWRPRTAERKRQWQWNTVEQPKLKWDLKSLEVAKKTQEFRLTRRLSKTRAVSRWRNWRQRQWCFNVHGASIPSL